MTINDSARQAINEDLKRVKAAIRKKEDARNRLDRDIDILRQRADDLDKSLED